MEKSKHSKHFWELVSSASFPPVLSMDDDDMESEYPEYQPSFNNLPNNEYVKQSR